MNPEALSQALRTNSDPTMRHRREVIGLSLAAAGSMGLIALYQSGMIRHIPEPPLPRLDADKVDASAQAFKRFQVGDAFVGFVAAAATFATAPLVIREAREALSVLSDRSGAPPLKGTARALPS